jgi:RNA polymerase sigma-70 factor (ECF subfamily)
VKAWLFTTLHREFLKVRRRQTRFSQCHLEEVADELPAFSAEAAQQADCCEVLRALSKLDGVYQAAVALFYLDNCPYKDIAVILDVPLGTVKSRIARGIVQLREILSDDSCGLPFRKEGISSSADNDEPGAAPGDTLIRLAVAFP